MTARVHQASVHVIGPDAAQASELLRAAEAALPRAVVRAAEELGDEVLLVRRLDLSLVARLDASSVSFESLTTQLAQLLRRRVREAKRGASDNDVATFPTEGASVGAYLAALCREGASQWPYRALRHYGRDPNGILTRSLERGRVFTGDVLAALASSPHPAAAVARIADNIAAQVRDVWLKPGGSRLPSLPPHVVAAVADVARDDSLTAGQRDLLRLSTLFAAWPPARALDIEPVVVAAELPRDRGASVELTPRRATTPTRRVSAAGGLVFWATLLSRCGLEAAIQATPAPSRTKGALRWAIGRGLQRASLSGHDPLLMLWSGEEPETAFVPWSELDREDPEPFARAFVRCADEAGALFGELKIAAWGDRFVAVDAGELVVDHVEAVDAHAAVEAVVHNFVRRAGRKPTSVSVESFDAASADALMDVMPNVPDSWRGATSLAASFLRVQLRERYEAALADTQAWPAIVIDESDVELRARDVRRIANGRWLNEGKMTDVQLAICDRVCTVRVTR